MAAVWLWRRHSGGHSEYRRNRARRSPVSQYVVDAGMLERAALFTGRYPLRTNVFTAIGNNDLANYVVNPNETTIPMLLKKRVTKARCLVNFTSESRATILMAMRWCRRWASTTTKAGSMPPGIRHP
jgi:hypothetical protein